MGTNQSAGHILPTGGKPNNASGTVILTLPAYPYPMVPHFTGKGSMDDGGNYVAVTPTTTLQDNLR
jgi:hypothetical protein